MAAKKRVLAVDDDPVALGALKQILSQRGYEVITCGTGEDALGVLGKQAVDMAILDINMPGVSGYEVCRRLRQEPKTQALPVIFLTARGTIVDMSEGAKAGSDLYLVKPVMAAKLINMVEMFLSADAPLSKKRSVASN